MYLLSLNMFEHRFPWKHPQTQSEKRTNKIQTSNPGDFDLADPGPLSLVVVCI